MIADYARGDARTVFVMPVSLSTRLGCCGIVESKPPCSFAASKKRESSNTSATVRMKRTK